MTQFQNFLSAALNMKKRKSQEDLAITALGSQGDQKSIQKVMRSFEEKKSSKMNDSPGISPEEFSKRFRGGI